MKHLTTSQFFEQNSSKTSCVIKERKTFLPNLDKIEIDITYDCNLKCIACNRSCTQAPTKEQLDFSDIEHFVSESIELGKKWYLINILGGEPTLHQDFEKIIQYISEKYIVLHSQQTILQIVSNGFTAATRNLLENVKKHCNVSIDYNSFKTSNKIEYFSPFNDAPIDDENFFKADYSKACWVTSYCGIGLNKFGYYACSICGGIDRVLNRNRGGIKFLKDISVKRFEEQLLKFCSLCGNFKDYAKNYGDIIPRCEKMPFENNVVSESWQKMYNAYSSNDSKGQA